MVDLLVYTNHRMGDMYYNSYYHVIIVLLTFNYLGVLSNVSVVYVIFNNLINVRL